MRGFNDLKSIHLHLLSSQLVKKHHYFTRLTLGDNLIAKTLII